MKTCIPVQAETWAELKKKVLAASPHADMIEIWIDHLSPNDQKRAKEIKMMTKKKILIVAKPRREKGWWRGNEKQRVELLGAYAKAGVDYIDIGIDTDSTLIHSLKKSIGKKTKLVISYHDFIKTPGKESLKKIIRKAGKLGADIVKLATHAKTPHDNVTMMSLYHMKSTLPLVALCMGKHGKMSRVMGPLLGAEWAFVTLNNRSASAPGQLTVNEYNRIAKILSSQ